MLAQYACARVCACLRGCACVRACACVRIQCVCVNVHAYTVCVCVCVCIRNVTGVIVLWRKMASFSQGSLEFQTMNGLCSRPQHAAVSRL